MNTTRIGDELEERIYDLIRSELDRDQFCTKREYSRIFRKKGYFSKDRDKKIIFDISIEVWLPGADHYSLLILIECKNYSHPVPVKAVESFHSKAQQVAASKAIVVSTAALLAICSSDR